MKIETINGEILNNIVSIIETFRDECILRFEKDKIICISQNNIASIQRVTINKNIFSSYPELTDNEAYEVGIKINELKTALKGIKNDTKVIIDFGKNLDQIKITYKQKREFNYEMRVLDISSYNHTELSESFEKIEDTKNNIVVKISELTETLFDKLIFTDSKNEFKIIFTMTQEGCFVTDKNPTQGTSKIQLIPDGNKFNLADESVSVTLNIKLMNNITQIAKITDKVLITAKSDYPIKITAITPLVKIEQIIAPIVEND